MNVGQAIAKAVVRRYPEPWRERYETEVIDLIDTAPVSFLEVGELVRGLVVERSRAFIDTDHPTRTAFRVGAVKVAFALTFVASAGALGLRLSLTTSPSRQAAFWITAVVVTSCVLTIVGRRKWLRRGPDPRPLAPAIALALMPVHWIYSAFWLWIAFDHDAWQSGDRLKWLTYVGHFLICAGIAETLLSAIWPDKKLMTAIGTWESYDEHCRSAQKWVDGCHAMMERGVPSPLAEAEASLRELTRKRDDAWNALQALGYRQRFRT